jgi:hypothetical protein
LPQVRKVAVRGAKRPTGEVVRPEELAQIEEKDKQETDRNMEEMFGIMLVGHLFGLPIVWI